MINEPKSKQSDSKLCLSSTLEKLIRKILSFFRPTCYKEDEQENGARKTHSSRLHTSFVIVSRISDNESAHVQCLFLAYYVVFSHSLAFVAVARISAATAANRNVLTNEISKYNFKTSCKISKWTKEDEKVGPVCEERKPCKSRKCVDTCDDAGFKCEPTFLGDWILLKHNVCFGAHENEFGTIKLQHDAVMTNIKLVHVGGPGLTCVRGTPLTKWGCDYGGVFVTENVAAVITDDQNNLLYPSTEYYLSNGFFNVPGYNAKSPYLIFHAASHTVHKGQELRLHYGDTLFDGYLSNNSGESCADVYAKFYDE
ncbi:uncharacterized protein LOC130657862 [Hydractinia symbiolongicarpus]|uniref:uncharacterized protein LOC130657862 n=1 Tax=Hydractinia symbiolongicarpus TaxID=13093 RepID=UPI00254BCAF7|nr:uncharacterized protein LOC130657862 [Hydractinia symbiolongicarpus]